jgi:hypothetical protein
MMPDWLSQLAPAHAPPAPGFWPPAPGWWALALVALALAGWYWWAPARRLRRRALRELRALRAARAPAAEPASLDDAALARALESLLRRYALALFGSARVARLCGEAWLLFGARHGGAALAGGTGQSMLRAAFGGGTRCADSEQPGQWLVAAEQFIRLARAPRAGTGGAQKPR